MLKLSSVKAGVKNPDISENRKCRNFQTLTVMYVKVYISRMEMSQRINFWQQNYAENGKKNHPTFLVIFLKQPTECNFELKC